MGQRAEEVEQAVDYVNHPPHYTKTGKIEAITYIHESMGDEGFLFYCEGAVKKYLHRWRHKNGVQDLEKAVWYLERMIALHHEDME